MQRRAGPARSRPASIKRPIGLIRGTFRQESYVAANLPLPPLGNEN
jgi:hypothetical protein